MNKLFKLLAASTLLCAAQSNASIVFSFTESAGSVYMQSSGTLNTANLVAETTNWWGGRGIETNGEPESDIMGDTTMGQMDRVFGFHQGTDLSAWVGNMFTSSYFSWNGTGTTQFATWLWSNQRTPGIGIASEDMQGDLWSPDVAWDTVGTFASLGMTVGTYAIVDAVTNESITIKIGESRSVPEPSTLFLLGAGLLGLVFSRKKAA